MRFDPQKNFGYVSNCAGNTVSVIDVHRDREVAKITVGLAPRGLVLSSDGKTAYVSNSGENSLSIVDLIERKEVRKIAMGENPRHMAFSAKSNRLLVTQWGSDSVANLDLSSGALTPIALSAISVGSGARPYSVAAKSDGATAYVANTQASYLTVIDVASGKEKKRIDIGYGGRAAVFSSDEKYLFASVENSSEVVVVDTGSEEVLRRVPVGPSPRGVAIAKSLDMVLCGNFSRGSSTFGAEARNSLSVIDVSSPLDAKVTGHIPVGLGPCSVSVLQ